MGPAPRLYTAYGESHSLREWSRLLGKPEGTIRFRVAKFGNTKEGLEIALSSGSYKYLRRAKFITFGGETHTLKEWAEIAGLNRATFERRLKVGYSIVDALRKDPKYSQADKSRLFGGRRVTIDGETANIAEHCRRRGISLNTIRKRMKKGIDPAVAITTRILTPSEVQEHSIAKRWEKRRRNQAAALGLVI